MPQAFDKYPKTCVGTNQEEQIWRDFEMFNIHINAHKMRWLKDMTDIMDCHRFEDDFCHIPDLDTIWHLNQDPGASGVIAPACNDEVNGVLDLVTEGDDDDYGELTQSCECWQLVNCYPLYAEIRFNIDEIVQSDFWFGLIQGNNWFNGGSNNYVVFTKDDGTINLDFETSLAGATTLVPAIMSLVSGTWYRLGIHWDGDGTIRWFIIQDGNFPQTILEAGLVTTTIPTTELALGFGIMAGEAAVKTLEVDYIKCAQKRVIA